MIHFLYRWIYEDVYVPVWPNWVAGIIASGVLWFWKGKAWFRKHEEHQRKIAEIHKHMGLGKHR